MYHCLKCKFEWNAPGLCPCGEELVLRPKLKVDKKEILPCPWCGSNKFTFLPDDKVHGMHEGATNKCPVHGAIFDIDEWNTRI